MSLQLEPERLERLKAEVLRDLDHVERLTVAYRKAILGEPSTTGLQDLEHAVLGIRMRIMAAKSQQAAEHRFGKQATENRGAP